MSEGSASKRMITFFTQIPIWLWIASGVSFVLFAGFLFFLSQQTPDQYAMTQRPPWQHAMNHNELLAYHRALKSGAYQGDELNAKQFLYRQGTPQQRYAQQLNSNTSRFQALERSTPSQPLTLEQAAGFASREQPINKYSLQEAQRYVALERNQAGMISTSQIASTIPAGIYVQTASLQSVNDAAQLRQQLEQRGFAPFIQEAFVKNSTWFRVRLGPYPSMADAKQAAEALRQSRYAAQVIQSK